MRAAIYNPYLDTLGGGERYTLAFALAMKKVGYDVFVEWKLPSIAGELEKRFGIDLSGIAFIKQINKGDGYDICFWVSDGSIPLLRARKNYLHFQIPFQNVEGKSLMNRMKMFRINKVICNSGFTKRIIDKEYAVNSEVLYPPIDTNAIKPKAKENIILAVGRFSQLTQVKNQHILIKVFKNLIQNGLKGWRLVLAGGSEVGAEAYIKKIKKLANSLPVEIVESPAFDQIKRLYGSSKIFWSAAGYGINELTDPKRVEHFGITVVEAMSAGVVPLAFNTGGHKETVNSAENGYLWNTESELKNKTLFLINNSKMLKEMSVAAVKRSKTFSYEEFNSKAQKIIG